MKPNILCPKSKNYQSQTGNWLHTSKQICPKTSTSISLHKWNITGHPHNDLILCKTRYSTWILPAITQTKELPDHNIPTTASQIQILMQFWHHSGRPQMGQRISRIHNYLGQKRRRASQPNQDCTRTLQRGQHYNLKKEIWNVSRNQICRTHNLRKWNQAGWQKICGHQKWGGVTNALNKCTCNFKNRCLKHAGRDQELVCVVGRVGKLQR